jgi:nucleoid-associated protein Lsr2
MAQKIQTLFIDDIDGSEAAGTVRFGLDGAQYEIDLNEQNAEAMRGALAKYVDAARRTTLGKPRGARPGTAHRAASASEFDPNVVRTWAKANGIPINDRGRIPTTIVTAWRNNDPAMAQAAAPAVVIEPAPAASSPKAAEPKASATKTAAKPRATKTAAAKASTAKPHTRRGAASAESAATG